MSVDDVVSDVIEQLQKTSKLPVGCDLSDLGNEIGMAIGKYVDETKLGFEIESFIAGVKHGVSMIDGTH